MCALQAQIVCCLITYIGREENVRCDQLLAIELLSSRSLRAVYGTDAEKLILSRTGLSDEKVLFIDDYIVVSPAMKLLCRYVGFTISFVFQNMNALKPNGFISSKMWFWNVAWRWMIQSIRLQYQGVQFPQYTNCLQEKLDKLQKDTYLMICFSSVMLYFVNCYHWHKYLSAIKSKVDSSFSHTPHIELVGFDEIIVAYEGRDLFASRAVAMNEACSWHIKPLFQWIVNDNAPHAIRM